MRLRKEIPAIFMNASMKKEINVVHINSTCDKEAFKAFDTRFDQRDEIGLAALLQLTR